MPLHVFKKKHLNDNNLNYIHTYIHTYGLFETIDFG
jgi:hypothetical protein